MEILQRLLDDGDADSFLNIFLLNFFAAKLRASTAAKLGKALGSYLPTEYPDRAVTVLTTITVPPSAREEG